MRFEVKRHHQWIQKVIIVTWLSTASGASSAQSILEKVKDLFGNHMNDIAFKIAELPEPLGTPISGLKFSPDGNLLAVTGPDSSIDVWDWKQRRIIQKLDAGRGGDPSLAFDPLTFSPDGKLFAACIGRTPDNTAVRIWSTATWSIAANIKMKGDGGCGGIGFSSNSKTLVVSIPRLQSKDPNLYLYATETWHEVSSLTNHKMQPDLIAVNPAYDTVALAGIHWISSPDHDIGKSKPEFDVDILNISDGGGVKTIVSKGSGGLAWSPDGKRLAISGNTYIEIFDTLAGEMLRSQKFEGSSHIMTEWTPDGRYFVASDFDGLGRGFGVKIFDAQMNALLQSISGEASSISITRDSRYLAANNDGHISIWQFK